MLHCTVYCYFIVTCFKSLKADTSKLVGSLNSLNIINLSIADFNCFDVIIFTKFDIIKF